MERNYELMAAHANLAKAYLVNAEVNPRVTKSRNHSSKSLRLSSLVSIEELFKSVGLSVKVDDLDILEESLLSGTFKAKLVTIKQAKGSLKKGNTFYVINTYTEKGSLKTKDLVPEKIGVVKTYTKIDTFDKEVRAGIKSINIPDDIKIALRQLYDAVASGGTGNLIQMSTKLQTIFSKVKQRDRQAIGKDFGEILSLRWCLNQPFTKNMTSFYFSEVSNEPLVDYTIVVKKGKANVKIGISAKFEKGGAPSIKAVVENIDNIYVRPTGDLKKAVEVIKILGGVSVQKTTTSAKILSAHKEINSEAYKILGKIVGNANPTLKDISTFIKNTFVTKGSTPKQRTAKFKEVFSPLFDELGRKPDNTSLEGTIFKGSTYTKYHSCILSPMGYALVDYMNNNSIYTEILNRISQQLNTEQVYLNLRSNAIVFTKKLFSDAEFTFSYGANAKNSDNTGIKFAMK